MAQHDFVIDNGPGQPVRLDIQAALQALVSCNAGSVEPVTKYAYMLWFDTGVAPAVLRQRDGANTSWVAVATGAVPEAPIDGKTYGRKDAGWIETGLAAIERTYTAVTSTTWTKPTGIKALRIRGVGPGGGGGAAPLTGAATISGGAGGGAGGYLEHYIDNAADIPATLTILIAAAGVSSNPATSGGNSTISQLSLVFPGGEAGGVLAPISNTQTGVGVAAAGVGGLATGGNIVNARGGIGDNIMINGPLAMYWAGDGGMSFFGGWNRRSTNASGINPGVNDTPGVGGVGCANGINQAGHLGTSGGVSRIWLTEYY
jgi:hypothetical protein